MVRTRRIWVIATAVLALAGGVSGTTAQAQQAPSAAASGGKLPPGWRIDQEQSAPQLVWRSGRRVPMGDARLEFRSDGRLLGVPKPERDGHTFRLGLAGARAGALKDLQVWSGGRRLDTRPGADTSAPSAAVRPPAPLPANPVDPGKPGPYRTKTGSYQLRSVRLPGFSVPVEMQAVVVAPTGVSGARPLALFLHGRHATCYAPHGGGDDASGAWPCPAGTLPVPSHRGYLRDQQLLASQGYVTVSISANGINGQDWQAEDGGAQARSSLIRLHLAHWADWARHPRLAPPIVREAPRADLSRVLLIGHSRGGE
ncbi:hypothetical protein ABT404_50830, partial [Streptomyces hyaluromycini]